MKTTVMVGWLCFCLCTSSTWATTCSREERICPICSKAVEGRSIGSTSTGGCDLDLCPRYLGSSVIRLVPMTCTHCLYSGFLSDFIEKGKEQEGPSISEKVKRAVLEGKVLKPLEPIETGHSSVTVEPRVRQDLIWQTKRLMGARPEALGKVALVGSWIVRQDVYLASFLSDALRKRCDEWLSKIVRGKRSRELRPLMPLRLALFFLGVGEGMGTETDRETAALVAIMKCGESGEYRLLRALWPRIRGLLKEEVADALSKKVKAVAEQEAYFQRNALASLSQVKLDALEDEQLRFTVAYWHMELVRRLEAEERVEEAAKILEKTVAGLSQRPPMIPFLVSMSTALARLSPEKEGDALIAAYGKALGKVRHPFESLRDLDALVDEAVKDLGGSGEKGAGWFR